MTESSAKHPGRILYEQVMVPLGVSRNKLARDIDVPVGRISDIVAGKRGITPDTALRFAKYFGTTAELWLRLQSDFDLQVARTTTWPDAEAKVAVFEPLAPPAGTAPAAPILQAVPPSPPTPPKAVPATAPAPAPLTETPVHAPSPAPRATVPPRASSGTEEEPADDEDDEDIDIPEPMPAPPGSGQV